MEHIIPNGNMVKVTKIDSHNIHKYTICEILEYDCIYQTYLLHPINPVYTYMQWLRRDQFYYKDPITNQQ